mgnify:CR=1 FL=1
MFLELPKLKKGKMRYISSTHKVGEKHQDFYSVPAKSEYTIAEIEGPGIIVSFWMTIGSRNKDVLRRAILTMYWDGEATPSVEVPVGDFFGSAAGMGEYVHLGPNIPIGLGRYIHFWSLPIGSTSGGYYTYFPMPFNKALIKLINMSELNIDLLYYMIGYLSIDSVDDMGRFHAVWRRERYTKIGEPYTILIAKGRGHYIGTLLAMEGFDKSSHGGLGFLEGNMEILADGELAYGSTGTEDYFLSGWYFIKGVFNAPFHGLLIKDSENLRILAYRFHIPDPIPFERELTVRIHHGEWDEVLTDYSSVAYWYQLEPHYKFTGIDPSNL